MNRPCMAKFPGVDYLLIDSQLNEQEKMVRQTARQFVDEQVIPVIRDCFRDGRFPKDRRLWHRWESSGSLERIWKATAALG